MYIYINIYTNTHIAFRAPFAPHSHAVHRHAASILHDGQAGTVETEICLVRTVHISKHNKQV